MKWEHRKTNQSNRVPKQSHVTLRSWCMSDEVQTIWFLFTQTKLRIPFGTHDAHDDP